MLLFVGLGNPSEGHSQNRHNFGYMAVDEIARRYSFSAPKARFQGLLAEGRIDSARVMILKPITFMNDSGQSVGEAARYFKIDPASVFVFHDELDLAAGKVRVKIGGGHAGHNGLRSLDSHLGKEYWRIRLGIGHPGDKNVVHNHVLRDFSKTEKSWVESVIDAVADAAPYLTKDDPEGFMTRVALLTKPSRPNSPKPPQSDDIGEKEVEKDGH